MKSGRLCAWTRAISNAGTKRRIAVTPGGGVFADAVRKVQTAHGVDDRGAHDMALLAMAQFGHLLCGLDEAARNALTPTGPDGFDDAWARGAVPVWTPDPAMLATAAEVEPGWHVTSDSLAAWLARKIGAGVLVLVKSAPRNALSGSPRMLAELGMVDAAFLQYIDGAEFSLHLISSDEPDRLRGLLGPKVAPPDSAVNMT